MRIFLDTNVLLDVFLKRAGEPDSSRVIAACGQPWNEGFLAVHTLSNAFYIIESQQTRQDAWDFIRDVLAWASVAGVSTSDVQRTQHMNMKDFEDALQIAFSQLLVWPVASIHPAPRCTTAPSKQKPLKSLPLQAPLCQQLPQLSVVAGCFLQPHSVVPGQYVFAGCFAGEPARQRAPIYS